MFLPCKELTDNILCRQIYYLFSERWYYIVKHWYDSYEDVK